MKATEIHPKVAAAGVVGAPLALVLAWLAGVVGLDMPIEVAAAVGGLVAMAMGYLMPSRVEPPADDAGESPAGVLWTVFLVLAIVALVMWIL